MNADQDRWPDRTASDHVIQQILVAPHYIGGQLNDGKQIDIICLDMSEAFDKVDHTKLLGSLHQYGITGKLHDWFRSYLQGSKQQVTVHGATSRELAVTSGVPQGSLLGPMLFLLFVDDLPNTVKTSRVACYADNTNIFKSIDSITDCNALQSDFNNLVSLSELSGLISNQSKCKIPVYHPQKITCTAQLYYQRNAFGILRYREREVCGCQAILPRSNKWLNSVRKRINSSALCAELLGTSKALKRVVHFIFLSRGAISATQPKYSRYSPLAY